MCLRLYVYNQHNLSRFQVEVTTNLKGPGEEFLTNRQPTVQIPENCFDTIDGYYNPSVKCIFNYDEEALAMYNFDSLTLFHLIINNGILEEPNQSTNRKLII